jgi:hypothetical protein
MDRRCNGASFPFKEEGQSSILWRSTTNVPVAERMRHRSSKPVYVSLNLTGNSSLPT